MSDLNVYNALSFITVDIICNLILQTYSGGPDTIHVSIIVNVSRSPWHNTCIYCCKHIQIALTEYVYLLLKTYPDRPDTTLSIIVNVSRLRWHIKCNYYCKCIHIALTHYMYLLLKCIQIARYNKCISYWKFIRIARTQYLYLLL